MTVDPTGVWTVAGISFDADVAAKLEAVNTANTELKLYNALTAAGIENLKVENSSAYNTADKPADGFKTLEEVQTFVNEVNAEQTSDAQKVEQVEALVKLLVPAQPSQVQVLSSLETSWSRINPDFIGAYITELKTTNAISNATTFAAVQTQIDNVNIAEVGKLVNTGGSSAKDTAKRADYTKAVAAMQFVREDDAKVPTDKVKANLQKDLDVLNLVLNVKEASTAAQFANAYNALVAKVDNKTTIGTEDFYTDLRTKYMEATKVLTGAETVVDASDIEEAILKVNTQKRAELFNDVANIVDTAGATQTSTAKVLEKLQALAAYSDEADFDIKTVETTVARLEAYRPELAALTAVTATDYTGAAAPGAVTTLIQSVQTVVTNANTSAVGSPLTKLEEADNQAIGDLFWAGNPGAAITDPGEKAAALLAELKNSELALGNVVDANAAAYLTDIVSIQTAATVGGGTAADAIKALKVAVNDINLLVDINKATTAEEVNTVLLALSGNSDYINVPSADRLYVANLLLEKRNDTAANATKKFANVAKIGTDLGTVAGNYDTALGLVNAIEGIAGTPSTISDVITALEFDKNFKEKTSSEKATIAEAFLLGLEFNDTGALKTPFRTLSAVKTAAGL